MSVSLTPSLCPHCHIVERLQYFAYFSKNLPIFICELITRWYSLVGILFLSIGLENKACNLGLLFPGTCDHEVCRVPSSIVVLHKLELDPRLLIQLVDIFIFHLFGVSFEGFGSLR